MKIIRGAVVVLICLFLTGVGRADNDDKDDEKQEHETAKAVLAKATIDLTKAIGIAQAKVPTGKPVYAITAKEHGKLLFEVFFLVGDSVTEVEVDAVTGEVAKVEEGEDDEVEHLPDAKKGLGISKISFAEAIATAIGKVEGGKPLEVEFETEDDKLVIEVELLAGDKIMEVEIDPATGKVLEVEEEKD